LLATFSDTLANALATKLRRLLADKPRVAERIEVSSLRSVAISLYEKTIGSCVLAGKSEIKKSISEVSKEVGGHKFSDAFLFAEWQQVLDPWQIKCCEAIGIGIGHWGQCAFSFIFCNKGGKFPVALPRGDGQGPGLLLQILKDTELDRADLHS
jgi:hypothetical protein